MVPASVAREGETLAGRKTVDGGDGCRLAATLERRSDLDRLECGTKIVTTRNGLLGQYQFVVASQSQPILLTGMSNEQLSPTLQETVTVDTDAAVECVSGGTVI